jgi:hypothetical protein
MGLFEELHSENPSERDNGPDDSTLGSVPGLMSRNESDSSSDDDNSIPIPGFVSRDHVSSSDESDAADDNAPNDNGYNSSQSEIDSESSIPVLIDRVVSDR